MPDAVPEDERPIDASLLPYYLSKGNGGAGRPMDHRLDVAQVISSAAQPEGVTGPADLARQSCPQSVGLGACSWSAGGPIRGYVKMGCPHMKCDATAHNDKTYTPRKPIDSYSQTQLQFLRF
jgi:hypothetical protein